MSRRPSEKNGIAGVAKAPPMTLDNHVFFGLRLDEEQRAMRDAIWSDDIDIVFVNALAGTGKTTIAIATAMLMHEYGKINEIVYMTAGGVHEHKQGLLPGTLEEKSRVLFTPAFQALESLGYDPERLVRDDRNYTSMKDGTACFTAITDSYIRGMNIGSRDSRVLLIQDEAQNETEHGLRTILTRVNDGSKVVVIGHDQQCDLKDTRDSGFVRYLKHFKDQPRCAVCTLTKNYRGWISSWADSLPRKSSE